MKEPLVLYMYFGLHNIRHSRPMKQYLIYLLSFIYNLQVIPGCKDTSVETLDWCKGRLFTGGLHAEITEWDLTSLLPKVLTYVWFFGILKHQNYKEKACAREKERLIKGN